MMEICWKLSEKWFEIVEMGVLCAKGIRSRSSQTKICQK